MKRSFLTSNWGLKILALVLAIVLYHSLKTDTLDTKRSDSSNDKRIFQWR